jgi:hypothetical protein
MFTKSAMALNSPDGGASISDCVGGLQAKSAARSSNNAGVTKAVTVDVIFAMSERGSPSIFQISVLKEASSMCQYLTFGCEQHIQRLVTTFDWPSRWQRLSASGLPRRSRWAWLQRNHDPI